MCWSHGKTLGASGGRGCVFAGSGPTARTRRPPQADPLAGEADLCGSGSSSPTGASWHRGWPRLSGWTTTPACSRPRRPGRRRAERSRVAWRHPDQLAVSSWRRPRQRVARRRLTVADRRRPGHHSLRRLLLRFHPMSRSRSDCLVTRKPGQRDLLPGVMVIKTVAMDRTPAQSAQESR